MNQLVFVEKNQVATDSLTVAKVFKKEHKHVVRDIKNQVYKLIEAEEADFAKSNFGLENFIAANNKSAVRYFLSEEAFTLVAMSYVTPEAMKFKVQFIQAFKKMREQLSGPRILTEKEQLVAAMKLTLESAEEIAVMKEDVLEVKSEMQEVRGMVEHQITLDHGEQRRVQKAIALKVYELEKDQEIRPQRFRELHREIRDRFGVASYRDIKRKDILSVIKYIEAWIPRIH